MLHAISGKYELDQSGCALFLSIFPYLLDSTILWLLSDVECVALYYVAADNEKRNKMRF